MTPEAFFTEVVHPNVIAAMEQPDSRRAAVNAIATLDALAGIIHSAHEDTGSALDKDDGGYKDRLAEVSQSFRIVRDTAYSTKHGRLKHRTWRLVRSPSAFQNASNVCGNIECGTDPVGGEHVRIEIAPGLGSVRASDVIADSFRMLKRIVEGEPARTDENETAFSICHPGQATLAP